MYTGTFMILRRPSCKIRELTSNEMSFLRFAKAHHVTRLLPKSRSAGTNLAASFEIFKGGSEPRGRLWRSASNLIHTHLPYDGQNHSFFSTFGISTVAKKESAIREMGHSSERTTSSFTAERQKCWKLLKMQRPGGSITCAMWNTLLRNLLVEAQIRTLSCNVTVTWFIS